MFPRGGQVITVRDRTDTDLNVVAEKTNASAGITIDASTEVDRWMGIFESKNAAHWTTLIRVTNNSDNFDN